MLTWRCTSPPSSRTRPLSEVYSPSSSSSRPPTVGASACTRSRLLVARRNGVGMYTVTGIDPSLPSTQAQITLTGVGQDREHELRRRQRGGDGAGREGGGTRGDPHEQALLASQAARPGDGVLVPHGNDLIDDVAVQHAGHERGADALDRKSVV